MIKLPNRIFFTGAPGSRWSGVAQILESITCVNTSDRSPAREYLNPVFNGHKGVYFVPNFEFEPILDGNYIDSAWTDQGGSKIVKSHHWAYCLDDVKTHFPNDWIMLVYRPKEACMKWWLEVGGFDIRYPDYSWYQNETKMLEEIDNQNYGILNFSFKHDLKWSHFGPNWVEENFGHKVDIPQQWCDLMVTILK